MVAAESCAKLRHGQPWAGCVAWRRALPLNDLSCSIAWLARHAALRVRLRQTEVAEASRGGCIWSTLLRAP